MFSLTKQERLVLFCLAIIILCGTTIHYLFKKYPSIKKVLSLIENEALYKKIDINKASAEEFEALPFVGKVTAGRIIAYRKALGRFETIHQLKEVQGIGEVSFKRILPYLKEINESVIPAKASQ